MPRESIPLVREGGFMDAEKFFVLAYEGSVSEKKYFEDLRNSPYFNDSGEIETIPLKKPKKNDSHPLHVKNLLLGAREEFRFRKTDEFWLIIDRDDWQTVHKVNFQEIADECKRYGNVHLALSNPCFEFWLLLHLIRKEDIPVDIQNKLLVNDKISKNKNFIDQYLADVIDNNRGYNKIPNPRIFMDKIHTAIANAKVLSIDGEDFPCGLGSDVYRLVEKLVKDH